MFKIVHSPQTIAWHFFTVIATVQLDEQEFKLCANIRYIYVLGNVLVTYNLMLMALAYVSSTVPWKGHRSRRIKVLLVFWGFCTLIYYLYFWLLLLLLHYIPKENNVLFTPYILPDTQKYLLHFECLGGPEKGAIHARIKRSSLAIYCLWSHRLIKHKCFVCKWCLSVGVLLMAIII